MNAYEIKHTFFNSRFLKAKNEPGTIYWTCNTRTLLKYLFTLKNTGKVLSFLKFCITSVTTANIQCLESGLDPDSIGSLDPEDKNDSE